jgi:hypothetical protein
METDETVVKSEPTSQTSTTISTPVPAATSQAATAANPAAVAATTTTVATTAPVKTKLPSISLPEVDVYLHLLVLLFAIDRQKHKQVEKRGWFWSIFLNPRFLSHDFKIEFH